tara:strand:- start:111886 stop:112464 length:579 start_codon:yes stop_codon:yes gene_type:complete
MIRFFYALSQGWQNRKALHRYITQKNLQINSLSELQFSELENLNVAVLVLDFDGVLAPHNASEPTATAHAWLKKMSMNIGEQRIAILSNKPKPLRKAYFQKHFPGIQWVESVAKKPYPDGLIEVAYSRGVATSRLLIVDDRLLTGILASCLAPCQARYFSQPICQYTRRPIKELFFSILRVTERAVFRWLGR